MKTVRLLAWMAGIGVAASGVIAQDATRPPASPGAPVRPAQPPPNVQPPPAAPSALPRPVAPGVEDANQVKFQPIIEKGPDGKTPPLEGVLGLMALHRNPKIDDATWAKVAPAATEWMSDVDQSVIDNLDFVEKLDGGILNSVKVMDMNVNRMLMEMMMQFLSIGPVTTYLETKGALTRIQSQVNTNIENDYLQRMLDEIRENAKKEAAALPPEQAEEHTVNSTSRFIFSLMSRDAMASYARQLDEAAPNAATIVGEMKLDKAAMDKLKTPLAAVKDAKAAPARRGAMKTLLAALPFDQRRDFLQRARRTAPAFNPKTAYVPPPVQQAAAGGADADPTKR